MTGRYDRQVNTVKQLIAKYGQIVTFKRFGFPDTGEFAVEDITEDIPMLFLSPSASGESQLAKELLQYLSGTTIASGVLRGYCGAFSQTPLLTDTFIRAGQELSIKAIDTLSPNGQVILHTVEFVL